MENEKLIKTLKIITEVFNENSKIRSVGENGFLIEITNKNKSVIFEFWQNRWTFRRWRNGYIVDKTYFQAQINKNYKVLQSTYNWLYSD